MVSVSTRYRLSSPDRPDTGAPVLTSRQRDVVEHRGGPLLVLAGPGTGKTQTLVEAVAARIADGVSPEEICVLTFSRRAALDLRTRIATRLGRTVASGRAMTFHAFCLAILRRHSDPDVDGPLRLLTAPEQEFRVREILDGRDPRTWPDEFRPAYGTRGFAAEVRAAMAAVRQLGLDPDDLRRFAAEADRPAWDCLADTFDDYLDVLGFEGVIDYAELVVRTLRLLRDPQVLDAVRATTRVMFVDEYQDTDPAQVALIETLCGKGADLTVIGDPDQSIYEFRGARPRAILDFPDQFSAPGRPVRVIGLDRTHRYGPAIAAAVSRVAARLPLPRALDADLLADFRSPHTAPGVPEGSVEVMLYDHPAAEADQIADLLRRAHLIDGIPWQDMAVLVRSGRRQLPPLSRALVAAGVPVEVAGDEIVLASELAVRPLLLALEAVSSAGGLTVDVASRLLRSPLGGLDSVDMRRLGRALRERERLELAGAAIPRLSGDLVREALADPAVLADLPAATEVANAARLASLLARARALVSERASAVEVLWCLWSGTDWPQRLLSAALGTGEDARRADRDLDAVCALFDLAHRSDDVIGERAVRALLAEVASQEVPADADRRSAVRPRGVRLLTAHRSKGLQWPLVVVAGVQEGSWPDLRRRGSLLEPDRLDESGLVEPPGTSVRLASERRLFYVACTRATRRLIVTAVSGVEGEGDQPSRFLDELGVEVRVVAGRPAHPLTLTALVADLRRASVDPQAHPTTRLAAADRLARLADLRDPGGRAIVPAADPRRWWGVRELTVVQRRPDGQPIRLSGSQLEALIACPRQWYLNRRAHASSGRSAAASFGTVVHVLAQHAAAEQRDLTDLRRHLADVWDQIPFDAVWLSASERVEGEAALERMVEWTELTADREVLGVEVGFRVGLDVAGSRVELVGQVDRLDRDPDGRVWIVDFKTSAHVPTVAQVAAKEQLGVYQLAAQLGAFDELAGGPVRLAGAELLYLRHASGTLPKILRQSSLDDVTHLASEPVLTALGDAELDRVGGQHDHPTWVHHRLAAAVCLIEADRYPAVTGPSCQWCQFAGSCPARPQGRQVVR